MASAGPSAAALKPAPVGTVRRSKWQGCMDEVFSKQRVAGTPEDRERYYQDLFCLPVNGVELAARLDATTEDQLLTVYQRNVSDLFSNAVKTLKGGEAEDFRISNAVETLTVLCRRIMTKKFVNWSLDVINVLAGSLERSDAVFTDLIAAVDAVLRDPAIDLPLRTRTLHLTLTLAAGVNQGSINAYFIRRDLFSTLASLVSDPVSSAMTFDAVLLLGLLANFRKYEGRNPYLVRMEDYVDETAMETIVKLVGGALIDMRRSYLDVVDDAEPSFVGSVSSLVSSLKLGLRPVRPVTPSTAVANGLKSASAALSASTNAPPAAPPGTPLSSSEPFRHLPPARVCCLLPLYDLLHSNKIFLALLLTPEPGPEGSFLAIYLSFASYLFAHASASPRAKAYARLVLVSVLVLVEEGGRGMCHEERAIQVRLCRQRVPPLPYSADRRRPPICVVLDCCVIFLRHNLHKKLNIDAYIVCLRLVHRVLITLQAARVRIDYEWTNVWQALVALGSLLAARKQDLTTHGDVELLAQQILDILSFAAIWAEQLFLSTIAVASLYFEVLRADQTLTKIGDLAGVGPMTAPFSATGHPGSPALNGAGGGGGTTVKGSRAGPGTIEAARNLRRIVAHFGEVIEKNKTARGGRALGPEEILDLVGRNIDSLDLIDSSSLDDVPRYSEVENEVFMRDLTRHVAQDALEWVDAT